MKKPLLLIIVVLIAIITVTSVAGAYYLTLPKTTDPTPSPTPTSSPTITPTPTSTSIATAAPTTAHTSTPQPTTSPTSNPTATQTPTSTVTPTPTASPSPTPTASPSPTPSPTPLPIGYSRSNPASTATPLIILYSWLSGNYNAKVTLLETIRGTEAWTRIHAANMFNSAPTTGNEFILVKIRFEYLSGPTADSTYDVSPVYFDAISESGVEYTYISNVPPTPSLSTSLYPGASIEGWAAYQVAITDTHPLLAFARNYDGTGGIWFKLY